MPLLEEKEGRPKIAAPKGSSTGLIDVFISFFPVDKVFTYTGTVLFSAPAEYVNRHTFHLDANFVYRPSLVSIDCGYCSYFDVYEMGIAPLRCRFPRIIYPGSEYWHLAQNANSYILL